MEVFKNGVWSKTQEPVYQIGEKQKDGEMLVLVAKPMSKSEAEKMLASMMPKKAAAPKPAPVKKAKKAKKAKKGK